MLLPDVNILVYAHRSGTPDHDRYRIWLLDLVNSDCGYGMSDLVLSGFLRLVTHPRIFAPPSSLEVALTFVDEITHSAACVRIAPGPRHWGIFVELARSLGLKGNDIPDAYLAALAIESGSELVSADRGFARFSQLRWRHPLG